MLPTVARNHNPDVSNALSIFHEAAARSLSYFDVASNITPKIWPRTTLKLNEAGVLENAIGLGDERLIHHLTIKRDRRTAGGLVCRDDLTRAR